jgi:hypothetical protein
VSRNKPFCENQRSEKWKWNSKLNRKEIQWIFLPLDAKYEIFRDQLLE